LTGLSTGTIVILAPKPPDEIFPAVRFAVAINTLKKPINCLEDRWAQMRTHKRVISRVRFLVEWDEDSQKQRANAVTVDVSHSGCMAIVGAPLPLHKQVRLIHPETGRKAEAQVVWRDHEAWDTGFELNKPDASFWGVSF
jgi:PilZ domain